MCDFRRGKLKRLRGGRLAASVLVLVAVLGLTMGVGSAQPLEGAWRTTDMGSVPSDAATGDVVLGTQISRNEGTEQPESAVTVNLPADILRAEGPNVAVTKSVWPEEVYAGRLVTYTVTFDNQGTGDEVLDAISDTLPAGFAFVSMQAGSDIAQAPTGTSGMITWSGPFTVTASAPVSLVYQVRTALAGGVVTPTNRVEAMVGGEVAGPASASVTVLKNKVYLPLVFSKFAMPHFGVTKEVAPAEVEEGETVVYTVRFVNKGHLPGILMTIEDKLPSGFTFLGMGAGSDVTNLPSGTTGTIVWNGPYVVDPQAELTVVYRVQAASAGGTYVNEVTATTMTGHRPEAPGRATVRVKPSLFFAEDFEDGIDRWTPYTNIRRMNEDQWFWDHWAGYDGSHAYTHYALGGTTDVDDAAEDTLTMYLGEGSEQWEDYRYSVMLNALGGKQIGVWFRGTYRESENRGQWVTGYYCTIKVRRDNNTDSMKLFQLRTEEEPGDETWPPYWYHVTNPLLLEEVFLDTPVERDEWHKMTVEVEGPRIKCYVDDELGIDFVDDEGSVFLNGTVGFYAYGDPYKQTTVGVFKYDDVLVEPLD